PQSTPPMPFTEWPYGATTPIGVTRANSTDSPLMTAIAHTSPGQWLQDNHIQVYGWLDGGFNVSTNTQQRGGNAPMAYMYTPDTVQLDQSVLYIDRVPDTVQTDHVDWGGRMSVLYGENYRYTTAYGISSYQLLNKNYVNGYDFPMMYGELYIPNVAQGLVLRLGRYISIPDIEAQLAPNNYMYSHSMTYSFDNYTNEGLVASLAATKNLILQLGVVDGTETAFWNMGQKENNPDPNPLYPGSKFMKDPGAQPTLVACARYTWNNGDDNIYPCMDGINSGEWGYNNLQWYGFTYYHKFSDKWHLSFEAYDLSEKNVPNLNNPVASAAVSNGGTPFSSEFMPFNAPNAAHCDNANVLTCTATAIGTVAYLNYQFSPLDNISFRPEFYDDEEGQRTGVKNRYANFGIGWQHWLSPQIEIRPEIDYDQAIDAPAFNGNPTKGISPDRYYTALMAADVILHF
ncbi:MAG: outer membrane beta-barrel protein, partial [Alphaproteobacteria bacterium]